MARDWPIGVSRLALLWQKCDFGDSPNVECVIHGEPAWTEAGDGRELAGRLGAVAWPVFGGAGEQDTTSDVSGLT